MGGNRDNPSFVRLNINALISGCMRHVWVAGHCAARPFMMMGCVGVLVMRGVKHTERSSSSLFFFSGPASLPLCVPGVLFSVLVSVSFFVEVLFQLKVLSMTVNPTHMVAVCKRGAITVEESDGNERELDSTLSEDGRVCCCGSGSECCCCCCCCEGGCC